MAEDHLSTHDTVENNEVITKSDTNLSQRLEETLNNIDNSVKELEDSIGKLDVQNQSSTNKIKQLSESRVRDTTFFFCFCMNFFLTNISN